VSWLLRLYSRVHLHPGDMDRHAVEPRMIALGVRHEAPLGSVSGAAPPKYSEHDAKEQGLVPSPVPSVSSLLKVESTRSGALPHSNAVLHHLMHYITAAPCDLIKRISSITKGTTELSQAT